MSVLIVEDDRFQASYLETLFRLRGYAICGVVKSGKEAIAAAQAKNPDILIVGVGLSGGFDGIDAAKPIIATRSCGLIFITGYDNEVLIARMNALKPSAIISKPFFERQLLAAVEKIVARRPVGVT